MPRYTRETPTQVCIEFIEKGYYANQRIELTQNPDQIPAQLYGRINPALWRDFMAEVGRLAVSHPYANVTATQCCMRECEWCLIDQLFGFIMPDRYDYSRWTPACVEVANRFAPYFAQAGCTLTFQQKIKFFWMQIDVYPPVAMPAAPQPGPPMTR